MELRRAQPHGADEAYRVLDGHVCVWDQDVIRRDAERVPAVLLFLLLPRRSGALLRTLLYEAASTHLYRGRAAPPEELGAPAVIRTTW